TPPRAAAGQSITVSGKSGVRAMVVNSGKTLSLNRLTIANGLCDTCNGGGIYNSGTLNVSNSTFSGNSMKRPLVGGIAWGGGIFNLGTLNVSNSTRSPNG